MLLSAGFHPITLYANTLGVVEPGVGGPASMLSPASTTCREMRWRELARLNDGTPSPDRVLPFAPASTQLLGSDGPGVSSPPWDRPVRGRPPSTAGSWWSKSLQREGVTHLFGLGGGHINPTWFAALAAGMKLVDVRHEAAAAHAAEGWALATGEPGVCVVTAGPGLTNALTGLANAFSNGSPLVCLAGSATLRGQDAGEVEALEQLELVRPVTKWARRVYHLDRIPEYVAMAFRHARSGRPGPVYLEIPIDTVHSDVAASEVTFPALLAPDQRHAPSAVAGRPSRRAARPTRRDRPSWRGAGCGGRARASSCVPLWSTRGFRS